MDPYLGEIRLFAGNYAPEDWRMCDGSLLRIVEYQALYALLGTTWGGDGSTTFGIPDLRGRLAIGQGTGTGLSPRTLGQAGGTETVVVTEAQMPSHTHMLMASPSTATTQTPGPALFHSATGCANPSAPQGIAYADVTGTNKQVMDPLSILPTGANLPHDNLMPALAVSFIIAVVGLYPSAN